MLEIIVLEDRIIYNTNSIFQKFDMNHYTFKTKPQKIKIHNWNYTKIKNGQLKMIECQLTSRTRRCVLSCNNRTRNLPSGMSSDRLPRLRTCTTKSVCECES